MWEQIRANKRKSVILVVVMASIMMLLGILIGMVISPNGGGASLGFFIALIVWLILASLAFSSGGSILMEASGAHKIEKKDHPILFNVVEEMTIAAGFSKMPDVYIMDDPSLNAFATGRDPEHAMIAVTSGLLGKLNRDELQGVIAHEMSHVRNYDILFMTMIGVMLGSIILIAEVFLRSLWYGGGRRRSRNSSSKGGGQAQLVIMAVAIIFAILAPILARIIYFASSRRREYLADAGGALLTRYPEGLASALEAIENDARPMTSVSRATAPMYISNPLKGRSGLNLMSTHPPIEERIRILRSMAGSVSYESYQQAWKGVAGRKAGRLPVSALESGMKFEARKASPDSETKDTRKQMRQVSDIMKMAGKFIFLTCLCGLKFKVPPAFVPNQIQCPRCGRENHVPKG